MTISLAFSLSKYHNKNQEALTPVQARQFLQIENQLGLFVDVTLASEMPAVGSKGKWFERITNGE
jgi:hypothetical protein